MDQDKKEHKLKQRYSETLRCVLYVVVVVFMMSCIIILFLEQQKMKQRLTAIDDKMSTIERILQNNNDKVFSLSFYYLRIWTGNGSDYLSVLDDYDIKRAQAF